MARLTAVASLVAAALLTLPASTPLRAEEAMPAAPASGPSVPTADTPNEQDRVFVYMAGVGGLAEVELGKLAKEKAASDKVRSFAGRMIDDHGPANSKLASLAKENGIPMPTGLDDDHKAMYDHLKMLSGAEFDLAYMRGQVQDHQKTAQLLEWEINSGQDGALKGFAADTLPTVLQHLELANAIVSELAMQAAR
jgi:putative membrane protein